MNTNIINLASDIQTKSKHHSVWDLGGGEKSPGLRCQHRVLSLALYKINVVSYDCNLSTQELDIIGSEEYLSQKASSSEPGPVQNEYIDKK